MYNFIETKLFTQLIRKYLSDEEYAELQKALLLNPEAGSVISGSGGVRKIRWRAQGRGKRSGYRVIYFVKMTTQTFWMLTIYPKNVSDNIPAHILKQIREEIENE
ncbi:MAG: type II toxin-antitoxin system RelE/ParE family toxin [Gemmatimonadetes bacterium]|nr:type II toxin-antitoxin system RelE/ParE family toxin [Gemmatimonadota bacterium]